MENDPEGQISPIAKMIRAMYNSLLSEGFNEPEAMELTKVWIATVMNPKGYRHG